MKIKLILCVIMLFISAKSFAQFGPQKMVDHVTVNRIFQGNDVVYVTFSGATLEGCANNGGYLGPSWATANGGEVYDSATNRMLSMLLSAKVQKGKMEVRYGVNSTGTGWNNCVINAIYLH